ncbi:MAG: alpha/beta fold hydrolase [Sporichthyaceae bacterium]
MTKVTVAHDGLEFVVHEAGPADGEPVLLLHGFPQSASSWDALVPLLTAAGYRTLAMEQRGYSAGARPRGRRAYTLDKLTADAAAVIERCGGGRVHVVGHDWGAPVAWSLAAHHPDKVATLTALSVPHPKAFLSAVVGSRQVLRSWYMVAFQLPGLPERLLHRNFEKFLRSYGGHSADGARRDREAFATSSDLTGPMNWYRALPFANPWQAVPAGITTPTLFVWSDGDAFLTRASAQRCARYVAGPFTFELLPGVSHWIPDEAPEALAKALLTHWAAGVSRT